MHLLYRAGRALQLATFLLGVELSPMIAGQTVGEGRPEDYISSGKVGQDEIQYSNEVITYVPPLVAPSVRRRNGVVVILTALFGLLALIKMTKMMYISHRLELKHFVEQAPLPLYVEPSSIPTNGLPAIGEISGPALAFPGLEIASVEEGTEKDKKRAVAFRMELAVQDRRKGHITVEEATGDAQHLVPAMRYLPVERTDTSLPSAMSALTSPALSEIPIDVAGIGVEKALEFSRVVLRVVAAKLSKSPYIEEVEEEFWSCRALAQRSLEPFLESVSDLWGEEVAKEAAEYLLHMPGQNGEEIVVADELDRNASLILASFKSQVLSLLKKELTAKVEYEQALRKTGGGVPQLTVGDVTVEDLGSDDEEDQPGRSMHLEESTYTVDSGVLPDSQKSWAKLAELRQRVTCIYALRQDLYRRAADELDELVNSAPMLQVLFSAAGCKEARELLEGLAAGKWRGLRVINILFKAQKVFAHLATQPEQKEALLVPLLPKYHSVLRDIRSKTKAEEKIFFGKATLDGDALRKLEREEQSYVDSERSTRKEIAKHLHGVGYYDWANALV